MKSTCYLIAVLAFSALMLSPAKERIYPPKEMINQQLDIKEKEDKIDLIISRIEVNLSKTKVASCR